MNKPESSLDEWLDNAKLRINRLVSRAALEASYSGGPLASKYRGERQAAQSILELHLAAHPSNQVQEPKSGEDGYVCPAGKAQAAMRAASPQAVPSEQPIAEQPKPLESHLTSASGGDDLQTALPRWKPIGSRPMDGTRYLAICGTGLIRLVRQADKYDRLPIADASDTIWPDLPTHWMPLPAPPEAA